MQQGGVFIDSTKQINNSKSLKEEECGKYNKDLKQAKQLIKSESIQQDTMQYTNTLIQSMDDIVPTKNKSEQMGSQMINYNCNN